MKRQPPWDQYEVALLVDAYIRISENGENKKIVLQELSKRLRNKAINEGLEVDDTFRNLNGMTWQIGFIERAFKNSGYEKRMPSKLFQQIVDMYQNQRDEFLKIYESAISKSDGYLVSKDNKEIAVSMSDRKEMFSKWLCSKNINEKRVRYICNVFEDVSVYAKGHRVSKKAIWDIDSKYELDMFFEKLHKDKIFKVVHKESANTAFQFEKEYLVFFENENDENDIEDNTEQKIINVVASKFVYGYRLGSIIDRMRLRDYLSEVQIGFDGSDEELEKLIVENGFVSNGKVLIESEYSNKKLNQEINSIFETGVSIIYYEQLFERKSELMEELHMVSADSLKSILKEKRSDLVFSKNFFSNTDKMTEDMAVSQEIIRVWGECVSVSADELSEKLPFIPRDKVRFYLSLNKNFVWVSEGVYTKLDSILISEMDNKKVQEFVASEIVRKGFVSLSELPLDSIYEENYELSEYAILFGTYEKCLSKSYSLHGRIVTEVDAEFDINTLMKQYCSTLDEISLDDAIAKVEDFTGVGERRIAYPALYDSMIRISEQIFVSQKRVHFDIEKIDLQIERFAKDGFVALKEITTFVLFPECGFTWNQYILESFCYRFSKKYLFRTNLFNGRNAGAIIDRSLNWDYQEIMAQAIARSGIKLEEEMIGKFLYDTGYMARSKFSGIADIAERAKIIREEDN